MKTDMELRQERDAHRKAARRIGKQLRKRSRKAHGLPQRKKGMGVRIGDRDDDLKEVRGYIDPSTFVRKDGTEVLKGADWRIRVYTLFARAKGQCEYEIAPGVRCSRGCVDPCHVKPRHPKRNDELSNLKAGCRPCHDLHDEQGWRKIRSGKVGA